MKTIIKIHIFYFILLILSLAFGQTAFAQDNKEKSKMEQLLQSRNFIFKAQSANPLRGNIVQLTSPYDLVVTQDTVRTFLPYFGRAFAAVPYNNSEGGIKITSTDFEYNQADKRKKRWKVEIEPNDEQSVQQLILNVSESGYATLQVVSTNRDPISFYGYVSERE